MGTRDQPRSRGQSKYDTLIGFDRENLQSKTASSYLRGGFLFFFSIQTLGKLKHLLTIANQCCNIECTIHKLVNKINFNFLFLEITFKRSTL